MLLLPRLVAFLCAGVAIGAADTVPSTFPRTAPEAQGISSAATPRLHRRGRTEAGCAAQHHGGPPWQGRRGRLVGAVCRARAAHDVLAQQELHVDRRGTRGRGRQAVDRRSRAQFLPGRRAGGTQREPEGDARPRPAHDDDRASRGRHPCVPFQFRGQPREEVSGVARCAQARDIFLLQHAGVVHPLGHRAEGHGPDRARLSATAAVRPARDREPDMGGQQAGHLHGRIRFERAHRRHRAFRAALSAQRRMAG